MGFFYWGSDSPNAPHNRSKSESKSDGWSETTPIRVSDIAYGHSPDKRPEPAPKYANLPILVKRSGGGYKVHDGNDRLWRAKERGDMWIDAQVKE